MIFNKAFLIIIQLTFNYCIIVLPLNILPNENYRLSYEINSPQDIIKREYKSYFFTSLEMGTPIQNIPLILKTEASSFMVTSINSLESSSYQYRDVFNFSESFFKNNKYDFFNESKSNSFILNKCDYPIFYEADLVCSSNETFLFYQDINLKNKTQKEKVYFELMRNIEDNITGEIGLNIYDINRRSFNSFLNIIKTNQLIDNYNWFFDLSSGDSGKGKIIIGSLPHEVYPENYHSDDLNYGQVNSQSFVNYWRMEFNKIYIKTNNNNNDILYFNDTTIEFKFDSNVIIGGYEYENYILNIFDKYFKEQKCFNDTILAYQYYTNKLKFYYCKKDDNVKKELLALLPDIYFYSYEFNYTLEIKKEDLFIIKNDFIIYKILFSPNNKVWYLGKPITLKYTFIFNPETKKIGFYTKYYNKKEEDKNNSSDTNNNSFFDNIFIKIIVVIILCIILVVLGVVIGKFIFGIKRKKRANELVDDDYDYRLDDENNNKNDKNNINDIDN